MIPMAFDQKKQMSLAEKLAMIDKISDKVNTSAGKKLMGRIGKDPDIMDKLTIKFIPSKCEDLNAAVGGGYPRSRCTIISGAPDSGKLLIIFQ